MKNLGKSSLLKQEGNNLYKTWENKFKRAERGEHGWGWFLEKSYYDRKYIQKRAWHRIWFPRPRRDQQTKKDVNKICPLLKRASFCSALPSETKKKAFAWRAKLKMFFPRAKQKRAESKQKEVLLGTKRGWHVPGKNKWWQKEHLWKSMARHALFKWGQKEHL